MQIRLFSTLVSFFILLFGVHHLTAQVFCCDDYIPNGSFELNDSIPNTVSTWRIVDNWTNAAVNTAPSSLYGSPDYFHTNPNGNGSSLPNNNFSSNVVPIDGDAVMGFAPFINTQNNIPREYLGVQFNCPLVVGIEYELRFFITQGTPQNQGYACNNISIFFSVDEELQIANQTILDLDPQFTITEIVSNTDWLEVVYTFTPDMPYQHMIVGNFASQANTDFAENGGNSNFFPYAYYFVDNFELKELIESPELSIDLGPDQVLCNAESTTLESGVPNASYVWSTGDTTQNLTVSEEGMYFVTVTSDCLVSDDSISIQTSNDGTIELIETICAGESFELNNESFETAGTYTQELTGQAAGGCDSIIILELFVEEIAQNIQQLSICQGEVLEWNGNSYSEAGIFTEVLQNAGQNGCDSIDQLELEIIEGEILATDQQLLLGSSLLLEPSLIGIDSIATISWAPSEGLSCSDCLTPNAAPRQDINYQITVTNTSGCEYKANIAIDVFETLDIYIPNAFSPNDDGFNDLFYPQAVAGLVNQVVKFQVFDRWGALIWEAADFTIGGAENAWDGRKNGALMGTGIYAYVLEVQLFDQSIVQLTGDILLIR